MNRRGLLKKMVAAFGLCAPLTARAARSAEVHTLRLGVATNMTSVAGMACAQFARAVERRSNGQIKIEIYPSLQLANEQATIDGLVSGVIDLASQSTAQIVGLLPAYQIFDMPFLFRNLPGAYHVLDGPIGTEFFAQLETKGMVGLGWGVAGFREISTTSKAIVVPEDMKGLRMRILPGSIFAATYQSLGAIPVTIDLSESFAALQAHTVDGIDNNLDSVTNGKYYTVIKHVAMSNHVLSVMPLLGSKRNLDALPAGFQKILKEEGRAVLPYWRSLLEQRLAGDADILKSNGVSFTEIQYAAFRKAVEPVYTMVQSKLGTDILQRVGRASAGS